MGPLWSSMSQSAGRRCWILTELVNISLIDGVSLTMMSKTKDADLTGSLILFPRNLAICVGNSPVTGEFPAQSHWRRTLMFSLICSWMNDWVNNREAGDLKCHQAHYDVTVMDCDQLTKTFNYRDEQCPSNNCIWFYIACVMRDWHYVIVIPIWIEGSLLGIFCNHFVSLAEPNSTNETRCCICKVLSHWLRPCSAIDSRQPWSD